MRLSENRVVIKKKILMICEAFGGGVFTYVSQLCNDMCDDFEIYLAYSMRPQSPENFRELLDSRIHLIKIKEFENLLNPINIIRVFRKLRRLEKDIRPDIIHLHSSIAGGIGRLVYSGKNNKIVYTPHGYAFILMGEGTIRSRFFKMAEKILGHTRSVTLTCCESEDDVAKTLSSRTAYIETGVNLTDLGTSLERVKQTARNDFTVFTLGRISPQKDPELFNQIAQLVPEVKFVWIGDGELRHVLNSENIEVTGWRPRKEALAMAKGADVFILCSLGEAIAMSLIENMFVGNLCLVSNTMGNKSVIKDGVNGYVCDTAQEYAQRITDSMKTFPTEIVRRAYLDVLTIYNSDRMKRKYILFYQDLIAGK